MCGIAGYSKAAEGPLHRAYLRPMCDRLVHRGPDAYGEYFDEQVALGHRRLSIIDVAGGAQPLGNEDGSVQIVFNGEIYNYRELREDLERRGHRFRTRSDTEVLVHLYEEEGEQMPERLNGMFAFAIWDRRNRRLFLSRDRFGEKPLYYTSSVPGTGFAFASELKALVALPGFPKNVDPQSVAEFLSNSYIADPATIYRNVNRLRAGHSLTVTGDAIQVRKYWAPPFVVHPEARFESCSEELLHLACDAVKTRMMSEVPLGAFLSGGVDSSAVVAAMASGATEPVKTFSIGFTSPEFDELPYARMVAGRYQTDHAELVVTPDVHEMLDAMLGVYDEPFGDASSIPTLYLSRLARQGVTVALSGDGADEIFGGYRRYRRVLDRLIGSLVPKSLRRFSSIAEWGYDFIPGALPDRTMRSVASQRLGDEYHTSVAVVTTANLQALLAPEVRARLRGYSPQEVMRTRFEKYRDLPPLLQMQAVDMETYLPSDILVKMDRATMAYSLESRAPWLDHRLAEFAGTLPQGFKLRGKEGKRVFKQAFRSLLPHAVLTRPKQGFAVPLAEWFRSSLKHVFEEQALSSEMCEYVDLREVRRIWREHQSRASDDHSWLLWNLLTLALWNARQRTN